MLISRFNLIYFVFFNFVCQIMAFTIWISLLFDRVWWLREKPLIYRYYILKSWIQRVYGDVCMNCWFLKELMAMWAHVPSSVPCIDKSLFMRKLPISLSFLKSQSSPCLLHFPFSTFLVVSLSMSTHKQVYGYLSYFIWLLVSRAIVCLSLGLLWLGIHWGI